MWWTLFYTLDIFSTSTQPFERIKVSRETTVTEDNGAKNYKGWESTNSTLSLLDIPFITTRTECLYRPSTKPYIMRLWECFE